MEFDLADWVLKARTSANLTQEELAHRVGLGSKANISSFEKNRSMPTFKTMWDIGLVCRYPLPQNEFNRASSQITNMGIQGNATSTIQNTMTINGNNSSEMCEYIDTEATPDNSMSPIIPQGSLLWVDRKNKLEIQEGKIYLIKLNGWKTIRRLFRLPNQEIRISAENKDYPDEIIPLKELIVIGRISSWKVAD